VSHASSRTYHHTRTGSHSTSAASSRSHSRRHKHRTRSISSSYGSGSTSHHDDRSKHGSNDQQRRHSSVDRASHHTQSPVSVAHSRPTSHSRNRSHSRTRSSPRQPAIVQPVQPVQPVEKVIDNPATATPVEHHSSGHRSRRSKSRSRRSKSRSHRSHRSGSRSRSSSKHKKHKKKKKSRHTDRSRSRSAHRSRSKEHTDKAKTKSKRPRSVDSGQSSKRRRSSPLLTVTVPSSGQERRTISIPKTVDSVISTPPAVSSSPVVQQKKKAHKERSSRSSVSPDPSMRSKRSRSRSPEDEEEGTLKFREKVTLIRDLYKDRPEIQSYPPTPPKVVASLARTGPQPISKSVSLPFNPTAMKVVQEASDKLAGIDIKSKASEAGGLAPKVYLRKPEFKEKSYRITSKPKITQAAQLPFQFRTLQPSAKAASTPSITLSHAEVVDMETQMRRLEVVLSHQDWFFGAARELAEAVTSEMQPVPEKLSQALELIQSGARAGYDAQHLAGHLTHNVVLRRRDSYIKDTLFDLPESCKRILRQQPLDQCSLFSVLDIQEVLKTYTDGNNAKAAHKASQPASHGNRHQGKPQQHQRQSVLDRSYTAPPPPRPSWNDKTPKKGGRGGGHGNRGRGNRFPPSKTPNKKGDGSRN
jgi:hypothetical protein